MVKLKQMMEDRPVGIKSNVGKLTKDGREILDSTPMAPPVGYQRSPSIFEQVRKMVRSEALAWHAQQNDFDTPEEADDFEVGDDYEPSSPYEENFDHLAKPSGTEEKDGGGGPKPPDKVASAIKDDDVTALTELSDAEIIDRYRAARKTPASPRKP